MEERGSVYLPQVNAFYVREFKMMYAAEEAARFLHHACRGLPARGATVEAPGDANHFYAQTVEYALGYFGSRVLYPARPEAEDAGGWEVSAEIPLSERRKAEASSRLLGYMLGNALYDAYLKGRVPRRHAAPIVSGSSGGTGQGERSVSRDGGKSSRTWQEAASLSDSRQVAPPCGADTLVRRF